MEKSVTSRIANDLPEHLSVSWSGDNVGSRGKFGATYLERLVADLQELLNTAVLAITPEDEQ